MNDEFLTKLRDLQADQFSPRPRQSFSEWSQDKDNFAKSRGIPVSPGYNPGVGMVGRAYQNTSSFAPTGPRNRPSGNQGTGLKQFPQQFGVPGGNENYPSRSKYADERLSQPPPWIDDVDMANVWYSPMEPVWPFGPPYYNVPREWDFPVGYNLNYVPKRMALYGMLRAMRSSWGVLATVESTRMDQLLRIPWTIQRKDKPRQTSIGVEHMKKVFRKPDGKMSYSQWSRKLLFDLFDIDAPSIYISRDRTDQVQYAQVLDGATIFPLIDDTGRRPDTTVEVGPDGLTYIRRQPAFQQIIYGLPMINLSEDELHYPIMRPRPELPMFGYSPIEQMLIETTEAIRKTLYQAEFWRNGSMPELIVTVPDQWTPRQIASFQAHFDAVLSGNLTLKSKVRFVPGGMKPFDIKNASGESLWSNRDEMLIRLACYAFSVSPTPFIKQTNRSTAQNAQQTAEEEGLYPLMTWWKDDVIDPIINAFGYDDVEFVYLPRPEVDLLKQAQIQQIQINEGVRTRNEIRAELGEEPFADDGDIATVTTGAGIVPLHMAVEGQQFAPGSGSLGDDASGKPKLSGSKPKGDGSPQPKGENTAQRGSPRPHGEPSGTPTTIHKLAYSVLRAATKDVQKPSKHQKKAGNYKKAHVWLQGLSISIETPKGKKRHGHEDDGTKWSSKMAGDYGYLRGTLGADGDQIDVCIGRHPKSPFVFVVDQFDAQTGLFDEHKVFLGYRKSKAVMDDYFASNGDGLGPERLGAMVAMSMDEFKRWLKTGDHKHAIARQGFGTIVARRGALVQKMDTISTGTNLVSRDLGPQRKKRMKKTKKRLSSGPRWLQLNA